MSCRSRRLYQLPAQPNIGLRVGEDADPSRVEPIDGSLFVRCGNFPPASISPGLLAAQLLSGRGCLR